MATYCIFLNDLSGSVRPGETEKELIELFRENGAHCRIYPISKREVKEAVDSAAANGEIVVAAGGDGTIGSIASHVVGSDALFGVLPLGTLNHFAKDLGISMKLEEAVKMLVQGRPERVDTGEVNGVTFLNNSSLGLYTRLVAYREVFQQRGHTKWIAFLRALFHIVRHFHRVRIRFEIDGKNIERRTPLAFIGNNPYHLEGWQSGSRESLGKGVLQLAVTTARRPLDFIRSTIKLMLGLRPKEDPIAVYIACAFTVSGSQREMAVATDGEVRMLRPPLEYRIRPRSLNVIVPAAST